MMSLPSSDWSRVPESETPNQALEQTRDSVLRYGEVIGSELLNFFVLASLWPFSGD